MIVRQQQNLEETTAIRQPFLVSGNVLINFTDIFVKRYTIPAMIWTDQRARDKFVCKQNFETPLFAVSYQELIFIAFNSQNRAYYIFKRPRQSNPCSHASLRSQQIFTRSTDLRQTEKCCKNNE